MSEFEGNGITFFCMAALPDMDACTPLENLLGVTGSSCGQPFRRLSRLRARLAELAGGGITQQSLNRACSMALSLIGVATGTAELDALSQPRVLSGAVLLAWSASGYPRGISAAGTGA